MTRVQLIDAIAEAMSIMEGFTVPGTLSQRNANPGNVRRWRDTKGPYPQRSGYVDFNAWAADRGEPDGLAEGWRVLKALIGQYIDGRYNQNPPTFYQMYSTYAPSGDGNTPRLYAEYVAKRVGAKPDAVIKDLIA